MMNSFIIDFFVKIKYCKSGYLGIMGEIYSSEVESLKPHKKKPWQMVTKSQNFSVVITHSHI